MFGFDLQQLMEFNRVAISVLKIIISVVVGITCGGQITKRAIEGYRKGKKESQEMALRHKGKKSNYDEVNDMLIKTGTLFRFGEGFTPFDYTLLRAALSFIGFLLGTIVFGFIGGLIGMIIGFVVLPICFHINGNKDNKDMLDDIQQMYGIVALQLKNNVFISKVLYECFLCTKNRRLRMALRELSLDIERMHSVSAATRKFADKFNNEYIELFSMVIEQAQDNGKTIEMLNNIERQMEIINEAIEIREEEKEASRGRTVGFLIFFGVLIMFLFIVYSAFADSDIGSLFG